MHHQALEVQTIYVELLEQVAAYEAQRAIGHLAGSFVTKTIKGQPYYYFQYLEPGGAKRQVYLGRKDDALDAVVHRFENARGEIAEDQASIHRLCALLRAGGAMTTDMPSARVIRALADAGVFRLGGVLVGPHAFVVIGNVLGVRWTGVGLRTQDVDAGAENRMSIALSSEGADVPGVLERLEMGFLPVPGLDPVSPTTSFKVRGQGLRVDLLAPAQRAGGKPVILQRFSAAAQPLRFLDYVMEDAVRAVVINGGGVSVVIPDPARFALHKLIVAGERPAIMHAKREKDLWQASQVLEILAEERPGDLPLAWEALRARGTGWTRRAGRGLEDAGRMSPGLAERVWAIIAD